MLKAVQNLWDRLGFLEVEVFLVRIAGKHDRIHASLDQRCPTLLFITESLLHIATTTNGIDYSNANTKTQVGLAWLSIWDEKDL
jgi:hypothetical protein